MYGFGYNAEHHVLAVVCVGQQSDADHEELLRQFDRLDRDGAWRGHAVAVLFSLDARAPAPSVYWRKRFAEHRAAWRSPHVYNATVIRSAVQRGVITAMNWLKPEPAHVKTSQHATVAEAAAWLELQHGTPASLIHALLERAQPPAVRRSAG